MPTFEELLEVSLRNANSSFEKALADLNEEIATASNAIEKLSGGRAMLVLDKIEESDVYFVYRLMIRGSSSPRLTELPEYFMIEPHGYPIRCGPRRDLMYKLENVPVNPVRQLRNRDEIQALLKEWASNPDSPLITKLRFMLRIGETQSN